MNKGFPKCPTKRKDIEPSTAESSLKRSKRGDPVCSIEDVNVKDIGRHYQKSATLTDAERYDLLKNHWKPDKSFEFPPPPPPAVKKVSANENLTSIY